MSQLVTWALVCWLRGEDTVTHFPALSGLVSDPGEGTGVLCDTDTTAGICYCRRAKARRRYRDKDTIIFLSDIINNSARLARIHALPETQGSSQWMEMEMWMFSETPSTMSCRPFRLPV
uniref:Uncharacterized protein n=1 Tax=Anopheles coluzzii TaxID=1518534 RepID=A0A8W7PDY4_ANOCL